MTIGLARFPFVRDLDGFDLAAQPSMASRYCSTLYHSAITL
jgi:hypothetical protein